MDVIEHCCWLRVLLRHHVAAQRSGKWPRDHLGSVEKVHRIPQPWFQVLISCLWPWSPWWLHECHWLMSIGWSAFWASFVLRLCQFPKRGDGPKMRFGEVINEVMSMTEISFCPIFILLFGVAWSYWSVKWGHSQERKFGSWCFSAWVEINYLYTLEACTGF